MGWECLDQPLEDETSYYLSWVIERVTYAELLLSARLWKARCYDDLCEGCMEGSEELKSRLAVDPRIGSNRVSSIAFCLE